MILGSVMGIEGVSKLDTGRMDEVLQIALDEITSNPIIDEQLRNNPVIMKELTAVVTRSLGADERKPSRK